MLGDISRVDEIYLICGYTDLRKSIDGLSTVVEEILHFSARRNALFLFCGRRCDRIKALYWDGDGYILLYKRLESGQYQWPRTTEELKELTPQQFRWLMEGLSIYQKKVIQPVEKQLLF
jgi:transposase